MFWHVQIQIGHNVQLGTGCVVAAQTGIAGSTTLGNNVYIGGQVGVAQHLRIGDNVRIAAKSGVMNHLESDATYGAAMMQGAWACRSTLFLSSDLTDGRIRTVGGSPAVPIMEYRRQMAHLRRLGKK
ncbi:hypothetical protein BBJ28_00023359 [Nothophytophthora sp. Chile5]|nr:hypothetical protein BBJ28_00023359 [Nothophytophthora sp. Chile5]